jgi:hypothetical protein
MDTKHARTLKVDDRVLYNAVIGGTVIERDYARFKVRWDDGMECSYGFVHAEMIDRET